MYFVNKHYEAVKVLVSWGQFELNIHSNFTKERHCIERLRDKMLKLLRLCAFHKKKERAVGNSKQRLLSRYFVVYFLTGAKNISNKKVDMDFYLTSFNQVHFGWVWAKEV